MTSLREVLQRIRAYNRLANIAEIGRRYFAMNAFDGVLTIIGVLMGNLTARVWDPRIVVSTGLSTCIAMGVSGLWGAYLTETAERKRDLDDLCQQTLTDLNETTIGRASRVAVVTVAVIDGLSPFLAALIVLVPFFLAGLLPAVVWAYYLSLGMALLTLFALGMFLGHVSRENILIYGVKTIVAGVISMGISLLLGE
ncbi:MAG: VIT1/CCC1 transporter family protein [Anaerolineae bacterium]|jgi:predicted membrane protein (TIGR00267 family)